MKEELLLMNEKYEEIKSFMEAYFKDYNSYAQDAETMPQMDKYWDPDIRVTAYMKLKYRDYPLQLKNRKDWQHFLIEGHRKIWENLVPREIIIDLAAMKVTTLLQIKKFDRTNDQQLCDLDGICYYRLNMNGNIPQIRTLDFFTGDPEMFRQLYAI